MAYKGPQEVTGPSITTDTGVMRFTGTDGDMTLSSGVTIDASNVMNGCTQLNVDNLRIDGNTLSSTDTDGNIIVAPDGTGEVSLTDCALVSSGDRTENLGSTTNSWDNIYIDGLTFDDGTNILSTYIDSSSYTPELSFGGATTGITYSTQLGFYLRVGNVVIIDIQLQLTNKGSATGAATVNVPIATLAAHQQSTFLFCANVTHNSSNTQFSVQMNSSTTTDIALSDTGDSDAVQLTDTNFANNSLVRLGGYYLVD